MPYIEPSLLLFFCITRDVLKSSVMSAVETMTQLNSGAPQLNHVSAPGP